MSKRNCPQRILCKSPHSKKQATLSLSLVSVFIISIASISYFKAEVRSEAIAETSREIANAWSVGVAWHVNLINLRRVGSLSEEEYKRDRTILEGFEDAKFVWATQEYRAWDFDASNTEDLLVTIIDTGVDTGIDLQSSPIKYALGGNGGDEWNFFDSSVEFLARRVALEYSFEDGRTSLADYKQAKTEWKISWYEVVDHSIQASNIQIDHEEITRFRQEIAELKAEMAEMQELRRSEKPPYPPEFWIAVAVAACSWFVMLYNFVFSLLKERRERKKEKREEETISLYSESDLQKVVANSHLSTRLKR